MEGRGRCKGEVHGGERERALHGCVARRRASHGGMRCTRVCISRLCCVAQQRLLHGSECCTRLCVAGGVCCTNVLARGELLHEAVCALCEGSHCTGAGVAQTVCCTRACRMREAAVQQQALQRVLMQQVCCTSITTARQRACRVHAARGVRCTRAATAAAVRCTMAAVVARECAPRERGCCTKAGGVHRTRGRAARRQALHEAACTAGGGVCVAQELSLHESVARGGASPSLRVPPPQHSGPPGPPGSGRAAQPWGTGAGSNRGTATARPRHGHGTATARGQHGDVVCWEHPHD